MHSTSVDVKVGFSEADLRLELAEENDKAIADGMVVLDEISPAAMLAELLEIEDLQ